MLLGVYGREFGRDRFAADRFCGLSCVLGLPGWAGVAIWPVLVR
jgi:hypothetical protein